MGLKWGNGKFGPGAVKGRSSTSGLPFDFTTGSLPSAITFTRASAGYYYSVAGTLTSAATDIPRFDFNPSTHATLGLLIEPASTNTIFNSGTVGFNAWTNTVFVPTANSSTAPDGTLTATLLTATTGGSNSNFTSSNTLNFTTGTTYTSSVYMKYTNSPWISFRIFETSVGNSMRYFNIQTGTVGSSAGSARTITGDIQDVGSGWYRLSVHYAAGGNHTAAVLITAATADGTPTAVTGNTYLIWGGDNEVNLLQSSYITTAGASATRAADSAAFTIPADVGHLTYTFDDSSTQIVAVSPGAYTIPTNLNRAWIKTIVGSA